MNQVLQTAFEEAWITVGCVEDVPVLGSRVVKSAFGDIAVFRAADDTVFALRNECPHKKGPLSEGIVHGHSVTCPLHNWVISLRTGEVAGPDEGCAGVIGVKVEAGVISLEVGRLAGGG
ncbi:nitrite reductase small subunit NirD [Chthonobacter rhizosphaerae]|uniref:nitrite reductase small subunit NirD n=1 Tax=Chthonobacter rhizosphaerae TaxID=2735553 RepID=UPI0015EE9DA7|nr:nitrite reductase small subunit NirD [Chthonobacter rhizosphaerae]